MDSIKMPNVCHSRVGGNPEKNSPNNIAQWQIKDTNGQPD